MWRNLLFVAVAIGGFAATLPSRAVAVPEQPPAGKVMIRSVSTGLCFTVDQASRYDGARVLLSHCFGEAHQRFTFSQEAPVIGGYVVRAVHSDKCLGIGDKRVLTQGTCRGPLQPRVALQEVLPGQFTIRTGRDECLDVDGPSFGQVTATSCTASASQRFGFLSKASSVRSG